MSSILGGHETLKIPEIGEKLVNTKNTHIFECHFWTFWGKNEVFSCVHKNLSRNP